MAARFSVWRLDPPAVGSASLEAYDGRAQPAADSDAMQPATTITSLLSSSSATPTPPHLMQRPQTWQRYDTDPTRHQLPPSASLSSTTAPLPAIDAVLDISASLKTLRAQFQAFQDGLGGVKSDVKDALSQLHALRTAQNKSDKSIIALEDVVGVSLSGARTRARGKRARGWGRGGKTAEAPLEANDAGVGTVPEKTLVQSMASIQSAIEALLARDSPASPSHVHRGWIPSVVGPTPQSEISSPLSSIVVPTPGMEASPSPTKEYTDASIQACPSSPASCPSKFQRHAPGFIPVDWRANPATLGRFSNTSLRPAAFTTEYVARFLRDTRFPSAPNTTTDGPISQRDRDHPLRGLPPSNTQTMHTPLSSCPGLGHQQADSINTSTVSGSSDTSTIPSAGATPVADSPPLARSSAQGLEPPEPPSLTTTNTDSSITSPQMRPSDALSGSTCDTRISLSGISGHEKRTGYPGVELDAEGDAATVISGAKAASGPIPSLPEIGCRPSGREADGEGLPSGLPTSRSETATDEREIQTVSRSTRGQGSDMQPKLMLRTQLPGNLPVIPTPPFWTPEPSAGEDRGMLPTDGESGSLEMVSGVPLPLTPSLFSPSEDGNGDVEQLPRAHKVAEEHTDFQDDVGTAAINGLEAAKGASVDVSTNDASLGPQTDRACVEASTSATPIIPLLDESSTRVASNECASQVPGMSDDADASGTPSVSERLPNIEHDPGVGVNGFGVTSSPPNAYDTGYEFHFPSARHQSSPLEPSTPSRYATPSEFSEVRPTQDEDEVWHALMLGESGMSTPLSNVTSLPMMFSHQPSRVASVHPDADASQSLSVHPSVLQLKVHDPSVLGHEVPANVPPWLLDESLSPLTSLGEVSDFDGDRNSVADEGVALVDERQLTNTTIPVASRSASASGDRSRGSSCGGRHSEPYHPPSRSASRALEVTESGRAVSKASGVRGAAGGPGTSLDELATLARRAPLKICLKVPTSMRGVKRKRDAGVDGEGGERVGKGEGQGSKHGDTRGELGRSGNEEAVDSDEISGEVGPKTPTPGTRQPTPNMSLPEPESSDPVHSMGGQPGTMSELSISRKSTRKDGEHRHKKRKRVLDGQPEPSVRYHVRNGQIVRVVSGPDVRAHATSPASRRKGKDNQATKAPPSRPDLPGQLTAHRAKPSPQKGDVGNKVSPHAGTWPELPSVFTHWDTQFIQCDSCDKWYHYGCVAIASGDPRLEPTALFICPTCHDQSARRLTVQNQDDTCARPDCPEPQITGDSEIFIVEKLVGRKKCEGYIYMWLAKWEGYPMMQATWIPKENLVGDGTRLLNSFVEDAVGEGADLSQDLILLQEAIDAGWDTSTR